MFQALEMQLFPLLLGVTGLSPLFGAFAAVNVAGALAVFHLVPETSGRSLEEVELQLWQDRNFTENPMEIDGSWGKMDGKCWKMMKNGWKLDGSWGKIDGKHHGKHIVMLMGDRKIMGSIWEIVMDHLDFSGAYLKFQWENHEKINGNITGNRSLWCCFWGDVWTWGKHMGKPPAI